MAYNDEFLTQFPVEEEEFGGGETEVEKESEPDKEPADEPEEELEDEMMDEFEE